MIIAEAGVNHNGDPSEALRLVDAAAAARADAVKFQTFRADRLAAPHAVKAAYQTRSTGAAESQVDMLRRLELSRAAHAELVARCRERDIMFLSSAFDIDSLDLLRELGVERFKVPSGEITNLPYLRHLGAFGSPVLLSTGMATLEEVSCALGVLTEAGTPRELITLLQCNTEYPTPMADANLRAMTAMRETFGVSVGYSDHTVGIEVSLAAAALGASVIEKHFTRSRAQDGPDHAASLEPGELAQMVAAIRNIEMAMGDGIKRPSPSEQPNIAVARKSIVAATAIRAGELFTGANLTVKRPGTGVSPMQWDRVLGRPAPRDFAPDELIELAGDFLDNR
jgi:N,N'-diacetyllegionaminate synthase